MKRKLFSAMLSAFALLLLMGASAVPTQSQSTLLAEEESAASTGAALETEAQFQDPSQGDPQGSDVKPWTNPLPDGPAEDPGPAESTDPVDDKLLIDGQPAPLTLGKRYVQSTSYVSLSNMAKELDPAAQTAWDGSTMTVTTEKLSLTAKVGQLYLVANGRYLYIPEGVQLEGEDQVSVPLRVVAKAFDAAVGYDGATATVTVTRGSGAVQAGDGFYNQDDLFWLSRVIYRESGNQSLEGQMAVGNVVLNRVADPVFPDSVEGVLAQKNQFSTYKSGVLAATDPSEESTIAAKLVMDGGVVEETLGALFFDSGVNSWAARNKRLIATFGDHNFYG